MHVPEAATGPEAEAIFKKVMEAVQAANPAAVLPLLEPYDINPAAALHVLLLLQR